MTACLFKVETERGWVLGLYLDKKSAKQVRNGFAINEEVSPGTWAIVGYSATVHRGPGHKRGETGATRHVAQGGYWVQSTGNGASYAMDDGRATPVRFRDYHYYATGRWAGGRSAFGMTNPCGEIPAGGEPGITNLYVDGEDIEITLMDSNPLRPEDETAPVETVVVRRPIDPEEWITARLADLHREREAAIMAGDLGGRRRMAADQLADHAHLTDEERRLLHMMAERARARSG